MFAAIIVIIVLAIIYLLYKQNFSIYTSGASQRYATEFSSTNQMDKEYNENFRMPLNL